MSKIKLNYTRLPISEKIARAKQIVNALTGNPNFPTPTPALPTISAATVALTTAEADVQAIRQSGKEKTSVRNDKEDVLDKLISQIAAYVESVAGDDAALIQSAGMDVKSALSFATDVPAQPQSLTPTAGDHDGEIDLSWEPVSGAKS